MQLENIVRILRKKKGLSQYRLSGLSGVGRSTISNIETGRYVPRVDVAIKVARVLGRPVEEVFFVNENVAKK